MTKDEALKLALEALEDTEYSHDRYEAITAIKEALAQLKQEPVAHINQNGVIHEAGYPWGPNNDITPLYTQPPQRKPLTDEQARSEFEAWHKDAYTQSLERYGHTYKNHHTRCRFQGWLAAHGIKGEA